MTDIGLEALSVDEACRRACVGRTTLYAAIKAKRLRAVKAGKKTLILVRDFRAWLDSLPAAGAPEAG